MGAADENGAGPSRRKSRCNPTRPLWLKEWAQADEANEAVGGVIHKLPSAVAYVEPEALFGAADGNGAGPSRRKARGSPTRHLWPEEWGFVWILETCLCLDLAAPKNQRMEQRAQITYR